MMPLDTVLPFVGAAILLDLAPGPDNLFVLSQSALYGRRAGFSVTAGLCTGLLVHTGAVALGVAALLQASPTAFLVLKGIGAAYLAWLALGAFRAGALELRSDSADRPSRIRLFTQGILMNITNPKVSLFFLAFLPQFVDPSRGAPWLQILLLGALFILTVILVFGGMAWAGGGLRGWLGRSSRVQILLNRLTGLLFLGLALKLALF